MQMQKQNIKTLINFLVIAPLAIFSMGNQSCNKNANEDIVKPSGERVLKKRVEIGSIKANPINYYSDINGTTEKFDFQLVANSHLPSLLYQSERYVVIVPEVLTDTGAGVSRSDYSTISQWQKVLPERKAEVNTMAYYESEDGSCLVDWAEYGIGGSINSLEASFGLNAGISVGPLGASGIAPYGDIAFDSAKMDGSLYVYDPRKSGAASADPLSWYKNPNQLKILSSFDAQASFTKTQIGFGINFGIIGLKLGGYFNSGLANVTNVTMIRALNQLNSFMDTKTWYSRVIAPHDTHMIIQGGEAVGIKEGDTFEIYNETFFWDGEACRSRYKDSIKYKEPAAVVVIEGLGEDIALGRVTYNTPNDNVRVGAKVLLKSFAGAATAQ